MEIKIWFSRLENGKRRREKYVAFPPSFEFILGCINQLNDFQSDWIAQVGSGDLTLHKY